MTAPKSPDSLQLRKTPSIGPRLGGRAALVGGGVVVVLIGVLVFNTESRKAQGEAKPAEASTAAEMRLAPAASGADALTRGVSDELKASSSPMPAAAPSFDAQQLGTVSPQQYEAGTAVPDLAGYSSGPTAPSDAAKEAAQRLREERDRIELEARKGATKARGWTTSASPDSTSGAAAGFAAPAGGVPGMAQLEAMGQQLANMQMPVPGQEQQPNDQAKKRDFVAASQQLEAPYLAAQRQAPRSAFELKTGHVIPGIMLRGVNSDLPGEVSGMVTENVYDSASGRYLLIPAWTKLFGKYDSEVAYGQSRALVVWTRLIFPDGSTLEIGGMQGADPAGYSGFKDQVDNHYGRLIGFSALSSVMAAGVQLSQPQEDNMNGQLSNRQIVAGEVGRELSQLGVEVTRRNLNVQPTIKIRNGYKFTITVNRDVAFASPYVTK